MNKTYTIIKTSRFKRDYKRLMKHDAVSQEDERTASVSARVHALRGVIRLPEDFDEREFKLERLAKRHEV